MLISGGNDSEGSVPLQPFAQALQEVSAMGLTIVVHTGLLTQETAALLAHTGIHRVSMDLIGDRGTIREVCHLDRTPAHFRQSLQVARQYALPVSPHIVAGLHYGSIRGEYAALAMAAEEGVDSVVIVILTPRRHTPMAAAESPPPADVEQLFRVARKLLPHTPLSLGCARPPGEYARSIERMAVDAGFNSIAYPSRETLDYVTAMNYEVQYKEVCCAMVEI